MLITILLLIFTVIVVPYVCIAYGLNPNDAQDAILYQMVYSVSAVIAYCFLVGEWSKNNSQVDKLWSIVPIYYVWHMTIMGDMEPRMVLMSILVTIWGVRLTYNFARRGAYQWKFWAGEEDYRWEALRTRPGFNNRFVWMLFNLFFISAYQNILIFLFTLPILTSIGDGVNHELNWVDYLLALIYVTCVVLEYVADQQQYDFQQEKHRRIKAGEDLGEYSKGFVSTGLWSIVRHPNYAMEQTIWLVFYLYSVHATGEWINWSIGGSILLLILFKGSSDFSEELSAGKYPEYKEYQATTPRFIPFTKRKSS
jgi:steroid 5-alpha reductase family enzyme